MYLKSLEVHGFKSFANKMLFEFHNGITAIVGPNGSGKSNVADAVRWVLGEQSARQLRGAKMEDVIFAGTQLRKPIGYAYVAITISNEDHKLDVPYEEVKIARRVYRSGESEYLLNGASCRLKDVQELLFDTGIGKEGYSIIGQGQIDKILSGKPDERRELFDEAAGIVKFKKRKEAAEKKLEEEQQNLVRIEDILAELEKQAGPLQEQAQKAKEYLACRDALRSLDISLFLSEYDRIQKEMTSIEDKQKIASGDLEEADREFCRAKEEYAVIGAELDSLNEKLEKKKEGLSLAKVSLNQSEGEIRVLQEQIRAARQGRERNQEQISSLQERMDAAKKERETCRLRKTEADREIASLSEQKREAEASLQTFASQIASLEQEISQCRQDMLFYLNANTDVKSRKERIQTLLEQSMVKKAEITKQLLENQAEASVLEKALEAGKKILGDISGKIKAADDALAKWRKLSSEMAGKEEALRREHRNVQQQYHMENSHLQSLKNLAERYGGYGQSIQRVMGKKAENPGIIGVVADIIRVRKEYELAVETALGGSIQNIVTDNEQTAKEMIAYLKANRYGRATFLPLTNIKARPVNLSGNIMSEPGIIGMASSLVEADSIFSGLVEYLLGRFIVVGHIDHAIALSRKYHHTLRIVTIEGELFNPGGSISGGAFKNSQNLLGRRREMEDAEKRAGQLKDRLSLLAQDISVKEKERGQAEGQIAESLKARQELSLEQNTAKLNYGRVQEDRGKNREQLAAIRMEQTQAEKNRKNLKKEMEQIAEQARSNEDSNKECEKKAAELDGILEQIRTEQEKLAGKHSEILLEMTAQGQAAQFAGENLSRIGNTMQSLAEEMEILQKGAEDAVWQAEEKEKEIQKKQEKAVLLEKKAEGLARDIEGKVKERDGLSARHKGCLEKREELSVRKAELDKECFRLGSQKEKLAEKMDSYADYMWEQYGLTYHAAKEDKPESSLGGSQLRAEIAKRKAQMKALGDVNVNAVGQYQEVQERYGLLSAQHSDLLEAADALKGIITELDVGMRRQFEEQFAEIRSHFDQVFQELFGGGHGTLALTDGEDILTAGIRIIAQPPGKKLQNMMQLSGGEKALTAIALLFAIQSLKPSPFCLLDEIEAALDDSNVGRFADYLHKLTKDTQFIVITHRQGTMHAADILYGITMQEKGVSTMVSVSLLEAGESL